MILFAAHSLTRLMLSWGRSDIHALSSSTAFLTMSRTLGMAEVSRFQFGMRGVPGGFSMAEL
jgi:hypothetical protein